MVDNAVKNFISFFCLVIKASLSSVQRKRPEKNKILTQDSSSPISHTKFVLQTHVLYICNLSI